MLLNLNPLKRNKDFRYLFLGQSISYIGSMINFVAVPFQIYEITKSNALVGYVSFVELIGILLFGMIGGTFADRLNRRKVVLISEILIMLILLLFFINSFATSPSVFMLFLLAGLLQSVNSFHRPAMDAMVQKIVDKKDFKAVAALGSLRYSIAAIIGPTVAGFIISFFGFQIAYFINFLSFLASFIFLYLMKHVGHIDHNAQTEHKSALSDAWEGLKFVAQKPVLMGTYIIDIVAMVFAFPVALYPALSGQWGGARTAGVLYSSMAIGSLVMALFSKWTEKIIFHGRAVIFAATTWGIFILLLGLTSSFYLAVVCLILAGAADTVSGIFRSTIWNESIPNQMRGRLSGIEMISYTSGPLLGNTRAGLMASMYSVSFSIWSGGLVCVVSIVLTTLFLSALWMHQSKQINDSSP